MTRIDRVWKSGSVSNFSGPDRFGSLQTASVEANPTTTMCRHRSFPLTPPTHTSTMIRKTASAVTITLALLLIGHSDAHAADKIDESPFSLEPSRAFPNLEFVRPLLLTHAGDGSGRVFVASQLGKIHVFDARTRTPARRRFFSISKRRSSTRTRRTKRASWAWRSIPSTKRTASSSSTTRRPSAAAHCRSSRGSASPRTTPTGPIPNREEEILRIKQPFWNHNGGTIAFGPDGYLYIALGDGGMANDPLRQRPEPEHAAGQDPADRRRPQGRRTGTTPSPRTIRSSAKAQDARGEIWAYGLRNVWRMAFDRKTGVLWAGDVGQDLWEEIDMIVKGGNYGWNVREGRCTSSAPTGSPTRGTT